MKLAAEAQHRRLATWPDHRFEARASGWRLLGQDWAAGTLGPRMVPSADAVKDRYLRGFVGTWLAAPIVLHSSNHLKPTEVTSKLKHYGGGA